MPSGTAHAYECRDAGEEENRKKETNNANKQTTSSLAGDAGSSQNEGIHGISDSATRNANEFQKEPPEHIRYDVQRSAPIRGKRFNAPARIPLSVTDNGHSTSETGDHKTSCTTLNNLTLPTHFFLALALLQHLMNIEPSTLAALSRRVWTPVRTWTGFSSAHTLSIAFSRDWATCKIKR
jgi:hypothetical protein